MKSDSAPLEDDGELGKVGSAIGILLRLFGARGRRGGSLLLFEGGLLRVGLSALLLPNRLARFGV
jgi:hypothetical protein